VGRLRGAFKGHNLFYFKILHGRGYMEFLNADYGIILQIILKKQGFTLLTYGIAKDSFL